MAESATSRPLEDGGEQSVGDLVSMAVRDVTKLIRCELDLARLELSGDARRIAMAVVLLGTAAFGGFLILVMLSFALAEGLITVGIWTWAAFLIAAGVWLVLDAIAVAVVYLRMRRMSGLRKTRSTVQDDLALLRRGDEAAVPAAVEG
jgi:uncharacterized membrane protein YqjE